MEDVQCFLGLSGWYHQFSPRFFGTSAPLHVLKKKGGVWECTREWQKAFEDLKDALLRAPIVQPFDFNKPFRVQTDASVIGLGEQC